jgi:hypothetical protein
MERQRPHSADESLRHNHLVRPPGKREDSEDKPERRLGALEILVLSVLSLGSIGAGKREAS